MILEYAGAKQRRPDAWSVAVAALLLSALLALGALLAYPWYVTHIICEPWAGGPPGALRLK